MSRPLNANLARTLQQSLATVLEAMTYTPAVASQFTAKVAAGAAAGATSLTLNSLQSGFTSALAGDTFTASPYSTKFTITTTVGSSGGAMTLAFTPALAGAVSTGAAVTVTRPFTIQIKGAIVGFDQSAAINSALITATTVKVKINARTMINSYNPVKPAVGDKITLPSGRIVSVSAVSMDFAGAFYTVLAS